jgi:hypothetical protein
VPPWASEGALFKHVAQGAKMPSYGPATSSEVVGVRLKLFDVSLVLKRNVKSRAETADV